MTLLIMKPGKSEVTDAVLTNLQSSLFNLRSSTGYKAAKRDNPKPLSFAHTFTGRAEADIEAAIQLLGGTVT